MLYNHGGWFGDPENQIAVIQSAQRQNVGIVYNFHHAHEQLERFPQLLGKMMPYLKAINLNGMQKEGPMILPIGAGDREQEMIRLVRASGFQGTVGILNHQPDVDAEVGAAAEPGGAAGDTEGAGGGGGGADVLREGLPEGFAEWANPGPVCRMPWGGAGGQCQASPRVGTRHAEGVRHGRGFQPPEGGCGQEWPQGRGLKAGPSTRRNCGRGGDRRCRPCG